MAEVRILREYCKGCGLCVAVCPVKCLRMSTSLGDDGLQPAEVVETAECTACAQCHAVCPDTAIEVYGEQRAAAGKKAK